MAFRLPTAAPVFLAVAIAAVSLHALSASAAITVSARSSPNSAATSTGNVTLLWSTAYSPKAPVLDGHPKAVLYQQPGKPQIAIMQANDAAGGMICGIDTTSGKLVYCAHDGTPDGDPYSPRGFIGVDDGTHGLFAYVHEPASYSETIVVRDAYSGALRWNNTKTFGTHSNGMPTPVFSGPYVFGGVSRLHVFDAVNGTFIGAFGEHELDVGPLIPFTSAAGRKLIVTPWYCNLTALDYTDLQSTGRVSLTWSSTAMNETTNPENPCPYLPAMSADGKALVVWSRYGPEDFIVLDPETGVQRGTYTNLPLFGSVIAVPAGMVVAVSREIGPIVFSTTGLTPTTGATLLWNASHVDASLYICGANDGTHGPVVIVCSAAKHGMLDWARHKLIGFDGATGRVLFMHELPSSVVALGPPTVEADGRHFYVAIGDLPFGAHANMTKFAINGN